MANSVSTSTARLVIQDPGGRTWSHAPGDVTLIGRGEHCDIRFDDDGVSTDHAEVRRHGTSYLLTDLASLNGTLLNGRLVGAQQRLHNADVIQIGAHRLEMRAPSRPATSRDRALSVELTEAEREFAVALTAPYRDGAAYAARPPTHGELAEELNISESTVKRRLDSLVAKLRVSTVPGKDRSQLVADRIIALGLDRG